MKNPFNDCDHELSSEIKEVYKKWSNKMKNLNMKQATKRYNDIMESLCYEYNTINTRFSENTDGWNLRDMVAECDYTLSTYYEAGHFNAKMKTSSDIEERKMWKSETGKLKRFIEAYNPFIAELKCASGHCSKYDN